MTVSTKELRGHPGKIIQQMSMGQEVIITYRGKKVAKIVPFQKEPADILENDMFGMWKDHEDSSDVESYVRTLRKGRIF